MVVERDLRRRTSDTAWHPDTDPRFGQALADRWHQEDTERDAHFRDGETARFFHSDAGACSRLLAYKALSIPRSNPVDVSGHFIMRFGRYAHEEWQVALEAAFPGAEVEMAVGEGDRAGHIDAVVTTHGDLLDSGEGGDVYEQKVVSIEAKTVGGYAYKRAIGVPPASYVPQGPSYEHVLQAALNAKASDADEAVILYFTREAISINMAKGRNLGDYGRVIAEWTLPRAEYEPLVEQETTRIETILGMVDDGRLPARKIPDPELPARHVITVPHSGEWVSTNDQGTPDDAGTTWHCAYCGWQDICDQTPAGRADIADVPVLVQLLEAQK